MSDEFNGLTIDNEGVIRPAWTQKFTCKEAIAQNKISRIYLGVNWDFDAAGGQIVGHAIAGRAKTAFS